jgi:hypothetical protein
MFQFVCGEENIVRSGKSGIEGSCWYLPRSGGRCEVLRIMMSLEGAPVPVLASHLRTCSLQRTEKSSSSKLVNKEFQYFEKTTAFSEIHFRYGFWGPRHKPAGYSVGVRGKGWNGTGWKSSNHCGEQNTHSNSIKQWHLD